MVVVAICCHFVHVASNKKSFSKVKKSKKKHIPKGSRCVASWAPASTAAAAVSAAVATVADGGDDVGIQVSLALVSIVINK